MRKARELLAFLAVQHPDGASGEAISEALWPESDPGRAAGQRNLALRKAREHAPHRDRPARADVDPPRLRPLPPRPRPDRHRPGGSSPAPWKRPAPASGDARLAACRKAVGLYRGELAEGDRL